MAKLLLVEDDNNLREIYEARLQAEGYTIVSAKDGEEALAVAKAEKPDVVISDVMMPKISGFEMLDILRNTDGLKHVKVIMLTALGQSDDQQRADKLGADRYLVKSQVTLEDIVRVTHELLNDGSGSSSPATPAPGQPAPQPEPTPTVPAEPIHAEPVDSPQPATPESSAVNSANPQSASQESAKVEANIEDFVAGATTEATPPAAEPVSQTQAADIAAEPVSQTQAANDQVMADAASSLANDDPNDSVSGQAPTHPVAPDNPVTTDGSTSNNKKVITPLDAEAKPDIQTLYALEQAKEQSSKDTPTPPPSENSSGPQPPDPSSIAL